MLACCDLITSPVRLGIANIQTFVIDLHNSYHAMYTHLGQIKHHQERCKKASDASKGKALADLKSSIQGLQDQLNKIESSYDSPYMEKTRVHYPEMFQILQKLRIRVQNDRRIKDLVPKEL